MLGRFHSVELLATLATLAAGPATAQLLEVPITELTDSMRAHPKAALVLISTDWCAYCRIQQVQLKKRNEWLDASPSIYFSVLDAETKETIVFNDMSYRFVPNGVSTGSHELAFSLGNIDNRLVFPTWVLLNENLEIIFKFPGVIKASELSKLLETVEKSWPP